MTVAARALACALVALWLSPAAAQPPPPPNPPPTVVAHGNGEIRAVPDRAVIALGAEQTSRTPKEAQAAVAAAMTAVQQRLAGAGVPKDAMRTTAYDVQPQFDWANGKQTLRGYQARHVIDVRVDDIARVGELLELAIAAGGTSVHGVRFDLKKRAALERDALTRAVEDARARAEAMAAGAGTKVVEIVRIEEGGRPGPEPVMMRMAAGQMAADAAPPVAPGETVIRASVTVTARVK
jgi:uncharacterized protein YggE